MPSTPVSLTSGSAFRGNTRELYYQCGRNIVAILLGLVVFLVACSGTSPAGTAKPLPTSTPVQEEPKSEGQALVLAKGCIACHGQNLEGSQIAPALPGHSEVMVKRQVRNPRLRMPAFPESQITDEDLNIIASYIAGLSGEGHAHPETIELTATIEMHHWMALEAIKAGDQDESLHHVNHIVDLLEPGEHLRRMEAILVVLERGEIHESEHEIEEMLAQFASPGLSLFQLHLRQTLVSLAIENLPDAQHHISHAQELSIPADEEAIDEVLELLGQSKSHEAEHEIQELLGEQQD